MITPNVLNKRLITAARLAFLDTPALDMSAVKHEPISAPRHINTAVGAFTTPNPESVWRTPTDADELCMTPVTTIPIRIPNNGFDPSVRNIFLTASPAI